MTLNDPVQMARLVAAEAALAGLLHALAGDPLAPDEVLVRLNQDGLEVVYLRCGQEIAGDGL